MRVPFLLNFNFTSFTSRGNLSFDINSIIRRIARTVARGSCQLIIPPAFPGIGNFYKTTKRERSASLAVQKYSVVAELFVTGLSGIYEIPLSLSLSHAQARFIRAN